VLSLDRTWLLHEGDAAWSRFSMVSKLEIGHRFVDELPKMLVRLAREYCGLRKRLLDTEHQTTNLGVRSSNLSWRANIINDLR
jgi:hypothetical protein